MGLLGDAFGAVGNLLGTSSDKEDAAYNNAVAAYPEKYKAAVKEGTNAGESKATELFGSGSSLPGEYQDIKEGYKKAAKGEGYEADRIRSLYGQQSGKLAQQQQQQGIKGSLAAKQQVEHQRAGQYAAQEQIAKSQAMASDRYAKLIGGEISDRATIAMGYGQLYGAGMQPPMPAEKQGLLSGVLGGIV